ncbi:MAG TPA: class I SAM-dependent methyltransferase [Solirubrobacteraceae bacterium]
MPAPPSSPSPLRRIARELRALPQLRALPAPVALFHARASLAAQRSGDDWSLESATRVQDLATLLDLARGRRRVAELGTATAWTATALALADRERQVVTYDPIARPQRERYLALAGHDARARVRLVDEPGDSGGDPAAPVDLLYIDSSHERAATIAEVEAWRPALAPGAIVVFDDYVHPDYPGVREAIRELDLDGEVVGTLFVHRAT